MRGGVYPYALAFALMLATLLLRLAIAPPDSGLRYLTFFPAVALAAVAGGFWSGLCATIIGVFLAAAVFTPPYYSLSIEVFRASFWPNMIFLLDGIIVSLSIDAMHHYRRNFARKSNKFTDVNAALLRSEAWYQNLMRTSLDGIHIMDIDGNLLEANDAFCRMLGYTQDEVTRLNVTDLVEEFPTEELRSAFKKNFGISRVIETTHRRRDRTLLDVEISISNMMLDGRYYVFASSRDITERKRLNMELLQSARQLRELVANYESSQEAERKAIAREVHDELGQILSTLRLDISMIRTRFGKHHSELMALIQNMTGLVDRAIYGVRNVSENLRPAVLGIGIVVSIKWLCDNFAAHSGIPCVLDSPDPNVELEEARAVVIFRIVQESLTNIMRHAHARNVKVAIGARNGDLHLEVRDDGMGFDMADPKHQETHGLFGMRERALACGGHLDVASAPGKGTVISVRIPVRVGAGEQ